MNTYNDNLRSTVLTTLSTQELDLSNLRAAAITSEVTLYFAQGAAARAEYQLKRSNEEYDTIKQIFDTTGVDTNVSAMVKTDADSFKATNALAVNNMAVAAANVQASANAILRLARTTAGIYSITSAADFGQDINIQSRYANQLMTKTAYHAERTSEMAMNASAAVAEVASATVAADAKSTDDMLAALDKVITGNFNDISSEVDSRSNDLVTAIDQEKADEATAEISDEQYYAAKGAYHSSNNNLNLDLTAKPFDSDGTLKYEVRFKTYRSPFPQPNNMKEDGYDLSTEWPVIANGYPVKSYYIMVAKNRAKSTFSLAEAEQVIDKGNASIRIDCEIEECGEDVFRTIDQSEIKDTDGDDVKAGTEYVVFVLAEFRTDYKKLINNFDDFLSAPSEKFDLAYELLSPAANSIMVTPAANIDFDIKDFQYTKKTKDGDFEFDIEDLRIEYTPKQKEQTLTFEVSQKADYAVQYRCMFLPAKSLLYADLLTMEGIRNWDNERKAQGVITAEFEKLLAELRSDIDSLIRELEKLNGQLVDKERKARDLTLEISRFPKKPSAEEKEQKAKLEEKLANLEKEVGALRQKLSEQRGKHETKNAQLLSTYAKRDAALNKPIRRINSDPGVLFNLNIAELVPQSIYEVAQPGNNSANSFQLKLTSTMTDNFGNPLHKDDFYIPVILTVATGEPSYTSQFINALSDFTCTANFRYLGA
ncbi:MAG: hypothetical protein NTW29_16900 [Bacteroidetes bacterium]|nr:hypothetical protein [Bacteroidota bacterium]